MTFRQNILANIKTTLEAVASIQKVEVNKATAVDLDTIPFPSAFVYSGEEVPITGPFGFLAWKWTIVIEFWSKEDTEDLLGVVHTAMAADETRGGFAVDCNRISSDFYVVDSDNDVKGLVVKYEIQYRHPVATL